VFSMERAACKLFGVITYGVHMTVYEGDVNADANAVRVWVPRRATTKPTYVHHVSLCLSSQLHLFIISSLLAASAACCT
jgi:hypothetical protein